MRGGSGRGTTQTSRSEGVVVPRLFATSVLSVFRHLVCDYLTLVMLNEIAASVLLLLQRQAGDVSSAAHPTLHVVHSVASEFPQHGDVIGYLQHEVQHEQS